MAKAELTPEQIAAKEERKKKRAEKQAKLEADLAASKEAHPEIWNRLDNLVDVVMAIPAEEKANTISIVSKVFRNKLRPGRKARSMEKMQARMERLKRQQAKLLQDMGEPVPDELQAFLPNATPPAAPQQ